MDTSDKTQREMVAEIYTILTNPHNGLCKQVSDVKTTIYGNGRMGMKTRLEIVWWGLAGAWTLAIALLAILVKRIS